MYENKNRYVETKRKNPKTQIKNESSKKPSCYKTKNEKMLKNYKKTKRILHKIIDKKNQIVLSKMQNYLKIKFFLNLHQKKFI